MSALAALFHQRNTERAQFTVFLVDDGSTDGTGECVHELFPSVQLLRGNGTLYWNGGMRMAFAAALKEPFDAFLFLNDDTVLYEDALDRLAACARSWRIANSPAIVVGSTKSPGSEEQTYGGIVLRSRGFALKLEKVLPDTSQPVTCDTMNGNIVLIPKEIAEVVGNLDGHFGHQFGDLDYGLRATRAGFKIVVAPGYFGECLPNSNAGTWRDSELTFSERWRKLTSPKGVPFHEWILFTRRHYGYRWPYYALSPYLKTIASSLISSRRVSNSVPTAEATAPSKLYSQEQ